MSTPRYLKRLFSLSLAALFTVAAGKVASDAERTSGDEVVAVVAGEKIRQKDIDEALALMSPYERRAYEGPDGQKMLLDIMIKNKLLLREAERVKLEKDPRVARDIADARVRILASEYFQRYIAATLGISDDEVAAYYAAHKEEFKRPPTVKLRHILATTEEEAKHAAGRVAAGEDFAEVAKQISKDEYTAGQGGLIGEVTDEYIPYQVGNCPEYKDVVFNLPLKTPSAPVKSDRGFHIFYVEERKEGEYLPLEQVGATIRHRILIPESDVRAYYEDHRDEYVIEEGVLARQIVVKTEAEAKDLARRARGGEDFESLVKLYTIDTATKNNGGLLGWVRPGGYIQGIGQNAEVEKALFAAKENEVVGPIKLDDGFHIFKVERRRAHRQMNLDEVRERIFSQLVDERRRQYYDQAFRSLEQKYKVERFGWARTYDDMPPAELMAEAEKAVLPVVAIQAYEKYVERFPNDPQADKALFMAGFLYSEELKDYAKAKDKFRALLAAYPNSDYASSASWMIEHMGEEDAGVPPIPAGTALPESGDTREESKW